jgi:hypothetical protein
VGFEPTNGGFADLSLGPLGYRAELLSIAKLAQPPGVAANGQNCRGLVLKPYQGLCALKTEATMQPPGKLREQSAAAISFLFLVCYFLLTRGASIFVSRRKRADSSGGVGLI